MNDTYRWTGLESSPAHRATLREVPTFAQLALLCGRRDEELSCMTDSPLHMKRKVFPHWPLSERDDRHMVTTQLDSFVDSVIPGILPQWRGTT